MIYHSKTWSQIYYQLHEGEKRRAWKIVTNQSPQLFDIDGNACRHSHNKVKQFCKPFECFDIHWDIMYSTGILGSLKEICFILNVPFRKPPQRGSHSWFFVFDCLSIDMTLIDLLLLLHYEWISSDFREMYEGDIKTIFDKCELNEKAKAITNTIQTKMKQKKLTDKGKEREEGIVTKSFYEMSTLLLNSNLFISILLFEHLSKRSHLYTNCKEDLLKIFAPFSVAFWILKWLMIHHVVSWIWSMLLQMFKSWKQCISDMKMKS